MVGADRKFRLSAGVPQVILSCWYDAYDFATHAEHLGIGIHGNRKSAPEAYAEEFCGALETVLVGGKAKAYVKKAEELKILCQIAGGRVRAKEIILELLQNVAIKIE